MFSVPSTELAQHFERVLGYLNFSDGTSDPRALAALDRIFAWAEHEGRPEAAGDTPLHQWVLNELIARLSQLATESNAFADDRQARRALLLASGHVFPAYLAFHRDLLYHAEPAMLFPAFFVGRAFEKILECANELGGWESLCDETLQEPFALGNELARQQDADLSSPAGLRDALTSVVVRRLNDYIGHRPVPVLESQQIEPYEHEWVRPIPIYIRGAGVSHGPHRAVVQRTLELIEDTDADILQAACLDPELLDEVALDPRAYDFDHPVNKRPNYHFGQWDPHQIDDRGRYRRFVVQHVTLESLLGRLDECDDIPPDQLVDEAAAVLAGTILMATGVSGWGPSCHGSDVTLGNLLPTIAGYRDEFYRRLIEKRPPEHRERLEAEAQQRRQPFGAARQHLNTELGDRRARQLQHVVLAKVFASMGHVEAAQDQVSQVKVPSARMTCQLECMLTRGDRAARAGEIDQATALLANVRDLLLRAIECGALADPWSILGFDTNFSLFPALENSIHDHRIDELVDLVERIFLLHARIWSEAAALDLTEDCDNVEQLYQSLALWWHQFAVHEVGSIDSGDSQHAYMAAKHVADGLNLWHKGGAAAGDVRFWAPHAALFDSPKAYTLLVERLLERDDHVSAMALLVNWLSRNEELPLEQGEASFHRCARQWVRAMRRRHDEPWKLTAKFLNYIEANAESYGQAPSFELGAKSSHSNNAEGHDSHDWDPDAMEFGDEPDDRFGAAYEGVVYRGSSEDGVEGELAGDPHEGSPSEDALARECTRVAGRLEFLCTLSTLWVMATLPLPAADADAAGENERELQLRQWIKQAQRLRGELRQLMKEVAEYQIPTPLGDQDSMMEYDRRRLLKESLLEQVMATKVEVANAYRLMMAAVLAENEHADLGAQGEDRSEEVAAADVVASLLLLDRKAAAPKFQRFVRLLEGKPLLYIPLSRGGECPQIISARIRQHCLRDLLKLLPRAGMLREVGQLLEVAREMERSQAATTGAVTEFDELFNTGYGALVETLALSAQNWGDDNNREEDLVACLEQLTESTLVSWLTHSRTLRLSVLERVATSKEWGELVSFIKMYGGDLFSQHFLNLGNVRAILHCGVANWLRQMQDEPIPMPPRLFEDIDQLDFETVVDHLTVILEAIIENYAEYRDYNSTTTLSDDGAMLYSLLDFLRLRAKYDRISWHLRPIVLAHEILVRNQLTGCAELWRRALSERIDGEADHYQMQLAKLQQKYAMRLSTVADRLGERFIKPLTVDRLVALVKPAMEEIRAGGECPTFETLRREAAAMANEPLGAGLDVPQWLVAIEEEVQRVQLPEFDQEMHISELGLGLKSMSFEAIVEQLENWTIEE